MTKRFCATCHVTCVAFIWESPASKKKNQQATSNQVKSGLVGQEKYCQTSGRVNPESSKPNSTKLQARSQVRRPSEATEGTKVTRVLTLTLNAHGLQS